MSKVDSNWYTWLRENTVLVFFFLLFLMPSFLSISEERSSWSSSTDVLLHSSKSYDILRSMSLGLSSCRRVSNPCVRGKSSRCLSCISPPSLPSFESFLPCSRELPLLRMLEIENGFDRVFSSMLWLASECPRLEPWGIDALISL